jgi:hypothetical protein
VRYDGYRIRLERDGDRVRLITKGGYNWTDRYAWIVESALKSRLKHFVLDVEAVVLASMAFLISTLCTRASTMRRCSSTPSIFSRLARLLARRPDGIFIAPFEQGEIGPDLFRKAFGLEGLVSKRADRPYRAGRSKDWVPS